MSGGMTEREMFLARKAEANYLPPETREDKALREKYPRHSLQEAREIDQCLPPCGGGGCSDGFTKLRAQERGIILGGTHT